MRYTSRIILILFTLQLVLFQELAQARVAVGRLQISPTAGIAVPIGSLRDTYRAGYTAGLSVDYMAAKRIMLGADVNAAHFTGSRRKVLEMFWEPRNVTYRLSLAEYGLHLRWYLTGPQYPNPFVEIGAGAVTLYSTELWHDAYWDRDYRSETVEVVTSRHFGAGLDLRISKLASGVVKVTYYHQDSGGGLPASHFWTARFALAFPFRSI
jgi:hypothetical protein